MNKINKQYLKTKKTYIKMSKQGTLALEQEFPENIRAQGGDAQVAQVVKRPTLNSGLCHDLRVYVAQ